MTRRFAAVTLVGFLASSVVLCAQEPAPEKTRAAVQAADPDTHLVSPAQLDSQIQESTATRQKQIEDLRQFLSTPEAEKAMKDAKIDSVQVKTAIPTLSNAELKDLSSRADRAQRDFAAGGLTTFALTLIILLVVLVILLAVYA